MNKKVKNMWIKALRSGSYKQVKGYMRAYNKFDPLGVLCDLYAKSHKNDDSAVWVRDGKAYRFFNSMSGLPGKVRKWAGSRSEDPFVKLTAKEAIKFKCPDKRKYSISELIDHHEATHKDIATIIRREL